MANIPDQPNPIDPNSFYDPFSQRAITGHAFEVVCQRELLKRMQAGQPVTLRTVPQEFDVMCGKSKLSRAKFNASIPGMDMSNGDLMFRNGGMLAARISCKSVKEGSTITFTENHMRTFCNGATNRFFIFAVVDGDGVPTGQPFILPAANVLKVFDTEKMPSDTKEGTFFVGLQHLRFAEGLNIEGWDGIARVLENVHQSLNDLV